VWEKKCEEEGGSRWGAVTIRVCLPIWDQVFVVNRCHVTDGHKIGSRDHLYLLSSTSRLNDRVNDMPIN
jgi:hypothetical protein